MSIGYFIIFISFYLLCTRKFKIPQHFFIVALFIFSILIYFPGIHQDDTNALYQYFITNEYSDWQPPIYTIWWHIFHVRWSEFIINTTVYYSGLIYISYTLNKNTRKWQNDILIIFSFYPIYFTQLVICLKDVPYTGFLILSICSLTLLQQQSTTLKKILLWALFSLSLFFVVGFRYNGVFAIFPILFYAGWLLSYKYFIKYNQWSGKVLTYSTATIFAIVISLILTIITNFITFNIFHAKHSHSPMIVMYNDLANIECTTGEEIIPDNLFIAPDRHNLMCNQFFINYYNYEPLYTENWSGAKNPAIFIYNENLPDTFYNQVKSLWIKTIMSHPSEYLNYRVKFFSNLVFSQWWWTPLEQNAENNKLQQSLAMIAVEERKSFATFNGYFLVFGTIFALFYVILRRKHNPFAIIIISSSILQLIGLFLLQGVPAARYFLWNYIAIILAIALADEPTVVTKNIKNKHTISTRKK